MVDGTSKDLVALLDEMRLYSRRLTDDFRRQLCGVAGKIFDAYGAVLGDNFTAQQVINGAMYGIDIQNWDKLDEDMREVLEVLGAKHPVVVDVDGAKFSNEVRQARLLGLRPLIDYENWLISGGQTFMDSGYYHVELEQTKNAIKAQQNALVAALVAAGDIEVICGMDRKQIHKITKAEIKSDSYEREKPFVVVYETSDGKKGDIDVLHVSITNLQGESVRERIYKIFFDKELDNETGSGGLVTEDDVKALAGFPESIDQELRVNAWKSNFRIVGIDLSQNANYVVVDHNERERITFYYEPKNKGNKGTDEVVLAVCFDERYGTRYVYACFKRRLDEELEAGRNVQQRFDSTFQPLLESMSVRDYVKNGRRLSQSRG